MVHVQARSQRYGPTHECASHRLSRNAHNKLSANGRFLWGGARPTDCLDKADWGRLPAPLPSVRDDFVEVYGPAKQDTSLIPDSVAGPIIAFIVDDVFSAHAEVAAAGIELLSEVIWLADGFGSFFLGHRMATSIALNKFQNERQDCSKNRLDKELNTCFYQIIG
jgi:hypothetical protein